MTDEFRMYDAAYLVGALTPADRAAFEEHLADCQECRRSVNQLAGMPGLLAGVSSDRAVAAGDPAPEVPATLLPRLLTEVQRTRFRRRMTTGLVGVVAAAVVAIALVVGLRGPAPTGGPPAATASAAQRMVPVVADLPVHATARLYDQAWGTRVDVRCVYQGLPGTVPPSVTYTMVVLDKTGATQQIAAWEAKAGVPLTVDGSTSWSRSEIASIQVRGPGDTTVLTLSL